MNVKLKLDYVERGSPAWKLYSEFANKSLDHWQFHHGWLYLEQG